MLIKSFKVFESEIEINESVKRYLEETSYNIQNSLGNCAFFSKDFFDWCEKNNQECKLYYLTQQATDNEEQEDHIVPVVNNMIIDFVWTPQGVSRQVRENNPKAITLQLTPNITPLVEWSRTYKDFGYHQINEISYQEAFGIDGVCQTIDYPQEK